MKNNRTPEIRFLGYTGEWDQRKLDSIVDRVKSYSLSRDVETSEYTGYKYIHYGDIHTKVADIIDEFSNLPNIKAGNYELLEKGDLVLTDASEDYQGIATPAVITIDMPYKLVSGLHTIALRPKQVDSLFLYYLINSSTFRKYGYRIGTGMKVFGISVTNLLKFEGMFPLLEEQTKIGNFLKQLDEMIGLHQQELAILKQTKQGFLKNMFPKEGESIPAFRFPEFTGDWDECKLGEIMEVTSVKRIHQSDWTDEGVRFLRARDIVANFKKQKVSEYLYISVDRYEEYSTKSGKVSPGDLLVTGVGSIGVPMLVTNDEPIYFKDGNIIWFKNDQRINGEFFYYSFENGKTQKYIRDVAGIGTVGTYTIDSGKKTPISLPVFEEQTKIGNFFKQLDEIIAIHQQELDALQETKKAFLQKMFV